MIRSVSAAAGGVTIAVGIGGAVLTGAVGTASASPATDVTHSVTADGDAPRSARRGTPPRPQASAAPRQRARSASDRGRRTNRQAVQPLPDPAAQVRPAAATPVTVPVHKTGRRTAASAVRLGALFDNQTPRLHPTQTGQSPDGVVTGRLGAVDPDSPRLTFTVIETPRSGTAVVGADGSWTYTPSPPMAATGGLDSFQVAVSDAASGFAIHGLAGLLHLLSFGLIGSRGDSSTATVTVTVAPGNAPPTGLAGQLRPADLAFEGFFRVPTGQLAAGQYATLAYGGAAMASRVFDGQRHFLLTGHRYANDPLVELVAPETLGATTGTAPVAALYRYWGDIYGGLKTTAEEPDPTEPNANWTEGLLWDEANQQLLWSYGNWYAALAVNNPVLGATVLGEDGPESVQGPWRTTAQSQQTRSFAVFLSQAVSAAAGGATLGLGGKMQSINATASWGPSLHVIGSATGDPATPINARTLVSHPIYPTGSRTPRAADYQVARNADGSLDSAGTEPPADGVGLWTELDETTGAVFVQTGSTGRSALVYAGGQASGLIWYGPDLEHGVADGRGYNGSGNHAERYRPVLWLVSEQDLVAAAEGRLSPEQVNPYAKIDLAAQFPELAGLSGLSAGQPVFAEDEGRLYVPFAGGTTDGWDPYPVIAVFTIAD